MLARYSRYFHLIAAAGTTATVFSHCEAKDPSTTFTNIKSKDHPTTLKNSYILLPNILSKSECLYLSNECDRMISEGYTRDTYAENKEMLRLRDVPLRRITIEDMEQQATSLSNTLLKERVLPTLKSNYPDIFESLNLKDFQDNEWEWASDEPAVNRYKTGGRFLPHEDGYSLTCIILLSDDFTGGGTSFYPNGDPKDENTPGILVEPLVGTALLFDGDITHAGNCLKSGTRHLYVGSFNVTEREGVEGRRRRQEQEKIDRDEQDKKDRKDKMDEQDEQDEKNEQIQKVRYYSIKELNEYDGSDVTKPILLAVYGDVFDVSHGGENGEPSMYGVGSGYHALAGKACTRALALMSVDKKEIDKGDDMAGLKKEDIDSAKSWHRYFQKKYKIVGYTWNK